MPVIFDPSDFVAATESARWVPQNPTPPTAVRAVFVQSEQVILGCLSLHRLCSSAYMWSTYKEPLLGKLVLRDAPQLPIPPFCSLWILAHSHHIYIR